MSIFEFVRSRLDILDIVGRHVSIKRMGNYYKGSCPFHRETDASFTVSPDKGIFYCFGCHKSGDAISFIAQLEDLTQIEALELLAEQTGLEIPSELRNTKAMSQEFKESSAKYFITCKEVAAWANRKFNKSESAKSYLNNRGITEQSIERFCVGFFPSSSMNSLIKDMANKDILTKDLCDIGFIDNKGDRIYSPFQDRIIFPIKDHAGRFIGFGGRVFKPEDQRAKYYNSKESEHFLKGQILFGQDLAKEEEKTQKTAYLVEGYLDCISMAQHGYKNTVATLGTSTTIHHLKILGRHVERLYVVYDGDKAGVKAILRLAELCWQTSLELFVVELPKDEDPSSFLEDGNDFNKIIENTPKLFEFFVEKKSKDFASATLNNKLKLSKEIIEVVSKISDSMKRNLLLQYASQQIQIPLESVKKLSEEIIRNQNKPDKNISEHESKTEAKQDTCSVEEQAFFMSLVGAEKAENQEECQLYAINRAFFKDFPEQTHHMLELAKQLEIHTTGKPGVDNFISTLIEKERNWVIRGMLKFEERTTPDNFKNIIDVLENRHWKRSIATTRKHIRLAQREGDIKKVEQLLNDMKNRTLYTHKKEKRD
jgi:DNA primase